MLADMRNYMLVVLFCFFASVASAEQIYAAYDGPNALKVGNGGTKVEKNGVEYWTLGAPSRPFQILGVFTDARKNRWWDGNAIGSASIAKKIKEVGGEAVVIVDKDTKTVGVSTFTQSDGSFSGNIDSDGSFSGTSGGYSWGNSQVIQRTTTQLLVIRYLSADELTALAGKISPLYPPAAASRAASPDAQQVQDQYAANGASAPAKRPAKTASGFCYDVPRGYVGTGSLNKPIITTAMPACYQLGEN